MPTLLSCVCRCKKIENRTTKRHRFPRSTRWHAGSPEMGGIGGDSHPLRVLASNRSILPIEHKLAFAVTLSDLLQMVYVQWYPDGAKTMPTNSNVCTRAATANKTRSVVHKTQQARNQISTLNPKKTGEELPRHPLPFIHAAVSPPCGPPSQQHLHIKPFRRKEAGRADSREIIITAAPGSAAVPVDALFLE